MKEIKNAFWDFLSILFSQALTFPVAFIYTLLSARLMGSFNYGVFNIFMAIYQFVFFLGFNWLTNSTIRFAKEEFIKTGNLRKTFTARLTITSFGFLLLYILLFTFKKNIIQYTTLPENNFWLLPIILTAYLFSDQCINILQSLGLMKQYAFSLLLRHLVLLVLAICLYFGIFSNCVTNFIIFEIISYGIIMLYSFAFIRIKYIFPITFDAKVIKNIFKYSWPLFLIFMCGYINIWAGVPIIKHYLSVKQVGIYQYGYKLAFYFSNIIMVVTTLTFPLFVSLRTKGKEKALFGFLNRIIPQLSFFWSLFIFMLILASDFVLRPLFAKAYTDSYAVFIIILAGISFQAIGAVITSVFAAFDLLKFELTISFFSSLLTLLFSLTLIKYLGIVGVAVATFLNLAVNNLLAMIFVEKFLAVRIYKSLLGPAITIFGLFIVFLTKNHFFDLIFILFTMGGLYIACKRNNMFSRQDLLLLEEIKMPTIIRNGISLMYNILS
jgi:O-antigen/teichoic acid export membrane protein